MSSLAFFAKAEFNHVVVESAAAPLQPIMIQGPMPIEAEYFAGLLDNVQTEKSGNATSWPHTKGR